MPPPPIVFISYSHEDPDHDHWVVNLAASLRHNGVDASLDTWDLLPGQDMTFFMESQIRNSDFVILICTPTYAQKSNIPMGGVGYEKNIISAEMLQSSDLRPKFIPVLRKGNFDNALPTYLGSKYAIAFRESRDQGEALQELLRAIYGQPHPGKPPLGRNPFDGSPIAQVPAGPAGQPMELAIPSPGNIDQWEKEAEGRFEYLRSTRLVRNEEDPFKDGFWQASFTVLSPVPHMGLSEFLNRLRASKTNRTGWDIGWVPTRQAIAPYPFKGGIEVWLAEDGGKGPAHSDFFRAEPIGRFSLFRGYQEDGKEFPVKGDGKLLDFSLVLWRVSEFLLYIESFARQMAVPTSGVVLKFHWTGLQGRTICYHKGFQSMYGNYTCHQESVASKYELTDCSQIKKTLIHDVHGITQPLFETFNFFSDEVKEEYIKDHIKQLFDPEKELSVQQPG